jgi:hypothetical protein
MHVLFVQLCCHLLLETVSAASIMLTIFYWVSKTISCDNCLCEAQHMTQQYAKCSVGAVYLLLETVSAAGIMLTTLYWVSGENNMLYYMNITGTTMTRQ